MKLTNEKIYLIASALMPAMSNLDIHIPAKANFFIQKNINMLAAAAQEIDKSRLEVAKHYGKETEDGQRYDIPEENIFAANQELQELFEIEQDLDIRTFSIEALGDAKFTPAQMQALMFMIED